MRLALNISMKVVQNVINYSVVLIQTMLKLQLYYKAFFLILYHEEQNLDSEIVFITHSNCYL